MKRLPYVIDNDQHKLAHVLNQVLDDHSDLAMDIASAYFNIRGYQLLSERLQRLGSLRLLLGADPKTSEGLGLRPDPAALKAALRGDLSQEPYNQKTLLLVEDLIRYLRNDKVQVRLFERGFLHAKCYLFYGDPKGGPIFERFRPVLGVVGSSNFTGPGLMTNRELNLVHKGIIPEEEVEDERGRAAALSHYTDASAAPGTAEDAFDGGDKPKVSKRISFESRRVIKGEVGAAAIWELADWYDRQWKESRDFKAELIELLDTSKFGAVAYTPYQVYMKALFAYYRGDLEADGGAPADLYSLNLAEFQHDAVTRARRILARHDGVMVCDSTGLGKTWIGLQLLLDYAYHKRWHALVICPAALRDMWQHRLHQTKIQAKVVTQESLGRTDFDAEALGKFDVVVVDECHNFRSRNSGRYDNITRILALNGGRGEHGFRKKVVLLTATPINNSVMDLLSQLQLITLGDNAYFAGAGIGRLDRYFYDARRTLLRGEGTPAKALSNLLDQVMIRRTRQFIRQAYPDATVDGKKVRFPERKLVTVRYDLEGTYAGIYKKVVRGIERLVLAPYDLETYKSDPESQDPLQVGRGQALVGIFKSRYLKRLESSVAAFRISVFRLMEYLLTFRHYIEGGTLLAPGDFWQLLGTIERDLEDDAREQEVEAEQDEDMEARRPVSRHKQIEDNAKAKALLAQAARLPAGAYDLQKLNDALDADLSALEGIYDLVHPIKPADDQKLLRLKEILGGPLCKEKVLVFTSYKDTARYIHEQVTSDKKLMAAMGDKHVRVIHGGSDPDTRRAIVQGFAPVSSDKPEWKGTKHEINLLFSTDVLSEGQNLQDCAYLVNYDLHWNPTRMIQRAGRIDRIGTDFDTLYVRNFFPDEGLEELLGLVGSLQQKIRQIDLTIGLDASVLGEAINPKVFNTIKRIAAEDGSVIDEEEAEAELASDEVLMRQVVDFIKATGAGQLAELPDGIHSGLHGEGARGVFLYYQRRCQDGPPEHFWRFYDADSGAIEDNRLAIADLIRCQPEEPRVVDPALKADIHTVMQKVQDHILASLQHQRGVQAAPKELGREQSAVLVALEQLINVAGVPRQAVVTTLGSLSRPLPKAPVKELKQAHAAYSKTGDAAGFLTACQAVAARYAATPINPPSQRAEGPTLTPDDLHLMCFEFLS